MTEEQRLALVAALRSVTAQCLGGRELRYGVLDGSKERLERAVVVLLRDRRSGRSLGFNATTLLPLHMGSRSRSVLHSGLGMVVPGLQGRGVTRLLVSLPSMLVFVRGGLRPLWVTNVSQVPAAIGMFGEAVADLYPARDGRGVPSAAHLCVAKELLAHHRETFGVGPEAKFDARLFVIRDAYTGGSDDLKKSWTEVPLHRDSRWNRLCSQRLDYDRGDDLLQVGRLTLGHSFRLLKSFLVRALSRRPGRRTSGSFATRPEPAAVEVVA